MTREEAIQILKDERWYMSRYSEEYEEAYTMAISALSAETVPLEQYQELQHCYVMLGATLADEIKKNQTEPSDLISRADAMGAVQDHFNADGFKGYDDGQKMMDRIKALPFVSAERVGEWVDEGYQMNCSVCGADFDYCDNDCHRFRYCPNCGARMEKGENDADRNKPRD